MKQVKQDSAFSEILESVQKETRSGIKDFSDMGVTSVETLKQNNDAVGYKIAANIEILGPAGAYGYRYPAPAGTAVYTYNLQGQLVEWTYTMLPGKSPPNKGEAKLSTPIPVEIKTVNGVTQLSITNPSGAQAFDIYYKDSAMANGNLQFRVLKRTPMV